MGGLLGGGGGAKGMLAPLSNYWGGGGPGPPLPTPMTFITMFSNSNKHMYIVSESFLRLSWI